MKRQEDQVLALAGVVQAARLVDQVSRTGSYPVEFLAPMIQSLFTFDADAVADVYGGVSNVKLGLHNLATLLVNRDKPESRDVVRYVFGILHLERRFSAAPDMGAIVRSRLEHAQFRSEHFSSRIQETCHSVAGIYQDTISTFRYRIRVTGSMQQLQNPANADIIRALLLAGIRSAVLWRQLGGRRWRLLTHRGRMLQTAHDLSRQLGSV